MGQKDKKDAESKPSQLVFYPFAYALLDEEISDYCWYCLLPGDLLKKCSGCHFAKFCGKKCQDLGWTDHRAECQALRRCPSGVVPLLEVRLLARIVTRHKLIVQGKDKSLDFYVNRTSKRSIMELCAHVDHMRQDHFAMDKFDKIYKILTNLYPEKALMDKEIVFQLHCRNYINRHAISNVGYTKEIGKGLYLDLCAYDHSCRPNTIFKSHGFVATMRPLDGSIDIRDRSRTFYTYIDLLSAKAPRRKMLKDSWYFDCNCERCVDDSEHLLTSVKCVQCAEPVVLFGSLAVKDLSAMTLSCGSCGAVCAKERVTEALGAMRYIDQICDQQTEVDVANKVGQSEKFVADNFLITFSKTLPDVNIYIVRLIQSCIKHTPPTDYENQFIFHERVLPALRICYPTNHPSLAYHLMALAQFALHFSVDDQKFSRALLYASEAVGMFEFALGPEHSLSAQANGHRAALWQMQQVAGQICGDVSVGEETEGAGLSPGDDFDMPNLIVGNIPEDPFLSVDTDQGAKEQSKEHSTVEEAPKSPRTYADAVKCHVDESDEKSGTPKSPQSVQLNGEMASENTSGYKENVFEVNGEREKDKDNLSFVKVTADSEKPEKGQNESAPVPEISASKNTEVENNVPPKGFEVEPEIDNNVPSKGIEIQPDNDNNVPSKVIESQPDFDNNAPSKVIKIQPENDNNVPSKVIEIQPEVDNNAPSKVIQIQPEIDNNAPSKVIEIQPENDNNVPSKVIEIQPKVDNNAPSKVIEIQPAIDTSAPSKVIEIQPAIDTSAPSKVIEILSEIATNAPQNTADTTEKENATDMTNQMQLCPIDCNDQELVFYPFAYSLFESCMTDYCWYCLKEKTDTMKKCTGCMVARFCDRQCHERAWVDHRAECPALAKCDRHTLEDDVRLWARAIVRVWECPLVSHSADVKGDEKKMANFEARYEYMCFTFNHKDLLDKELCFKIYCRLMVNRIVMKSNDGVKSIGQAIYLDQSAYDHSCRPNAVMISDGFRKRLRPLHDGVELSDTQNTFIAYIDLCQPLDSRRAVLRSDWHFECMCSRCTDARDHLLTSIRCADATCARPLLVSGSEATQGPSADSFRCSHCGRVTSAWQVARALKAMTHIKQLVESGGAARDDPLAAAERLLKNFAPMLPPENIYYFRLLMATVDLIEEEIESLKNAKTAAPPSLYHRLCTHLRDGLSCVRLCYPWGHPAHADHLLRLARVLRAAHTTRGAPGAWALAPQALAYAREAARMYSQSTGPWHMLTRAALGLVHELHDEMQRRHSKQLLVF